MDQDHYAVLGVSESATEEEIKRAYRRLARRYHPDSREEGSPTRLFHEVQRAYAVLSDPDRRRAYDRQRAKLGMSEESPFSWNITASRRSLYSGYEEQVVYLLVEIRPNSGSRGKRLPLNLCLVVDRSTSMMGARLNNVKQAANQIIDQLRKGDTLAIVTFSDRAEVVIPNQPLKKSFAKSKVSTIRAGGGTEILQGVRKGLAEIAKRHSEEVLSHLILLTDGQTYGDEEECIKTARRAGARRIGITAMGIGDNWNDELLDQMAEQSGGVSAYISSPERARVLLQERVRGLGEIYAQHLTLQIRTTEDVWIEGAFQVSPFLDRVTPEDGLLKLGELKSTSPVAVVLEVGVRQQPAGTHRLLQLEVSGEIPSLKDDRPSLQKDISVEFTPSEPEEESVPTAILSALSKVTLYCMQEQAWEALEAGDTQTATQQLEIMATRLFDLGERQLARAAMLEAGRVARGGHPTAKGRKELKYGTRSLAMTSRRKSND